ncbi:MAG TPA: histidinol-phosphate transaminase [Ghiorsea sp.]|nr:histidinol-phosphate transaminase [Ghiorsea sp.]
MSTDWLAQAVSQSKSLHPYIPGKPITQMLRELGLSDTEIADQVSNTIKLASNENPYGVSPKSLKAIGQAATEAHRYPDGDCFELKQRLAKKHGIRAEQLLIGNGSNEVLELIIRTFAGAGDEVVYSRRGFIVYALATTAAGAMGVAVPESDGYMHDLNAMLGAVNKNTKVVCIANPNNPTGALLQTSALQDFLDKLPSHIVVIIDEAYVEYVKNEIADSVHALKHDGLIISRTFSKAFALAGLRVGYAVANPILLAVVNRFREPFNVNMIAQAAALAALNDEDWVMDKVAKCKAERVRLEAALAGMNCLAAPSFANFVLFQHKKSAEVVKKLEQKGVIVRPLAPYGMPDVLRVSVGAPTENDAFLAALSKVLP